MAFPPMLWSLVMCVNAVYLLFIVVVIHNSVVSLSYLLFCC